MTVENRIIAVGGDKGGVGKSTTSAMLATHYSRPILGNDVSAPQGRYLNKVVKGKAVEIYRKLKRKEPTPNIPPKMSVIFDIGGWEDDRSISMLRKASVLIVPTYANLVDMDTTVTYLKKASQINSNILIIVNKAEKGDLEGVQAYFDSIDGYQFGQYAFIELADSTLFRRVLNNGESIAFQTSRGLAKWIFRNHLEQFETLIQTIETLQNSTSKVA